MAETKRISTVSRALALQNVTVNVAGRGANALILIVAIPVLVSLVGTEAWGVVGFSLSLTAMIALLDLGLGAAMTRDVARYAGNNALRHRLGSVVKTYDYPLIGIALIVSVALWLAAESIASYWLENANLSESVIADSLRLLAPVIGIQLLCTLYSGGLTGIQRQGVSNALRTAFFLSVYFGGIIALESAPEPDLRVFFLWQLFSVLAYAAALRFSLYHYTKSEERRWNRRILREGLSFAAGLAATAVLVVCLTQLDKLLLSRLLSLEHFGTYMLAVTLTGVQTLIVQPVHSAIYPQLTALMDQRSEPAEAAALFLRWCGRIAIVVVPLGVFLCFFSFEVSAYWLGDEELANSIAAPVAVLALGSMLNALATLPYSLQLAAGWPSLGLASNAVALVVMVPGLFLLTPRYGMIGAAALWAALNLGYVLVQVPLMFRRLLTPYQWAWWREAVLSPLMISITTFSVARFMATSAQFSIENSLLAAGVAAALAASGLTYLAIRYEHGRA